MQTIDRLMRVLLVVALPFLGQQASSASSQAAENPARVFLPFVGNVAPLQVIETDLTRTKYGDYVVIGNLFNVGQRPVYDTRVQVSLFSQEGQPLGVYTSTAGIPVTFPGEYNYFAVCPGVSEYDYPNAQYGVQVISWTLSSSVFYWPLTIVYSQTQMVLGWEYYILVNAEFRNDSPYPLTEIDVHGWELHQWYSISHYWPPDPLMPGETFTYTEEIVRGWSTEDVKLVGYGVVTP